MRKYFQQQPDLGVIAIQDVEIPTNSRDQLAPVLRALQTIFVTPSFNQRLFRILAQRVVADKAATGRTGMDLWAMLVLAVVRHTLDADYDRLHHIANYDSLVRGVMGVESSVFSRGKQYSISAVRQNVALLDSTAINGILEIVLEAGQGYIKKKTKRKFTSRLTPLS